MSNLTHELQFIKEEPKKVGLNTYMQKILFWQDLTPPIEYLAYGEDHVELELDWAFKYLELTNEPLKGCDHEDNR